MAQVEGHVLASNADQGVEVVDVRNPMSLSLFASLRPPVRGLPGNWNTGQIVVASSERAVVVFKDIYSAVAQIAAYDLHDPTRPIVLAAFAPDLEPGGELLSIALHGAAVDVIAVHEVGGTSGRRMTLTRFLLSPEGDMSPVDTIDIPVSGRDPKTPIMAASDSASYIVGHEAGLFSLGLSYEIHLPSVINAGSK